jgi:hypothetical protein
MSHHKITALLVILVSLAMPSTALARKHRALRSLPDPITLAQAAALEYWGEPPCGGRFTIATERPSPQMIEGLVRLYGGAGEWPLSWASWDSPSGEDSKASPPSTYTDCRIGLNSAFWPSLGYDRAHFVDLCTAITHEYGNLSGVPETEGTGEVMDRQGGEPTGPCLV